jgi:hypothetical protein
MTTLAKALPLFAFVAAGLVAGCDGSGKATTDAAPNNTTGSGYTPTGVVLGPLDTRCVDHDGGLTVQDIGTCVVLEKSDIPPDSSGCGVSFTTDAGASHADTDAGADAGASSTSEYGPTQYGSAAYDDDCKYYVSWVATPIQQGVDTYFTVTALRLADGKPASCAGIRPDISLSLTHGVPAPKDPATEIAPGVYKVGPIRFDATGNSPGHYWTVRFHLYEECNDTREDSPHGHVAFYVSVP